LSRFAHENPGKQTPWLAGEQFELALDSQAGALNSSTAGEDTLTITTRLAIRVGRQGDVCTTAVVPLDRLTAVEISDVERDSSRLRNGLIFLAIGIAAGWVTWSVLAVTIFSLLLAGPFTLLSIFLIAGYVFPDADAALLLHAGGYTLRQPLRSAASRRDAYLVAHRIYELMADASRAASPPGVSEDSQEHAAAPNMASLEEQSLAPGAKAILWARGADASIASVLTSRFEPAVSGQMVITDTAERIAKCVVETESATSYVSRQMIRNPENQEPGQRDYIWDLEFVAPDRFHVSQTGWSSTGEVHERWISIGKEFYRLSSSGTWQKPEDPSRFDIERQLNPQLTVTKYLNVLRQSRPTASDLMVSHGKDYLQLRYEPLSRESLVSILGNPSPPQDIFGAATIWIECETNLLTKAEVNISEGGCENQLIFEQFFASYDSELAIEAPAISHGRQTLN
jgi:hypothetical protein